MTAELAPCFLRSTAPTCLVRHHSWAAWALRVLGTLAHGSHLAPKAFLYTLHGKSTLPTILVTLTSQSRLRWTERHLIRNPVIIKADTTASPQHSIRGGSTCASEGAEWKRVRAAWTGLGARTAVFSHIC